MALTGEVLHIGGHRIRLTHPDRVIFAETGTTKADLVAYYRAVAPRLIPFSEGRPATRKQWMTGVGTAEQPGESFFHKNLDRGAPRWIARRAIRHADHTNRYPLINNEATLVWFVQRGTIEFHVPQWRFGAGRAQQNPDRIVFDLDPGAGAGLAQCAEVALLVRDRLRSAGLDPWPVTSGSKGIHVYASLDQSRTGEEVVEFGRELAGDLEAENSRLIVSNIRRSNRDQRVLIDWSQNHPARTTAVPYSVRGRPRPAVAFPREWDEIESSAHLNQVSLDEAIERLDLRTVRGGR